MLAVMAAILYPVMRFINPPESHEAAVSSVVAASTSELTVNSGKVFKFGNKPAIVVKTPAGKIRAFTAVCTHLNCTVQYDSATEHILCACHNGHFGLDGSVLSGPPPKPLEEFDVHVVGDEIHVSKKTT